MVAVQTAADAVQAVQKSIVRARQAGQAHVSRHV